MPSSTKPHAGRSWHWLPAGVASLATSLLATLALPPLDAWPLAFLAPMPLLWAAHRAPARRLGAALAATLGALPLLVWQEQWVFGVSGAGAALMVLYLALFSGALLWLIAWVAGRTRISAWVLGPVIWSGLEILRGEVLWDGYPWFLAGHPVIGSLRLAHAGAVIGAYGVSFLTVCVASAIIAGACSRGRARLVGLSALAIVAGAWAGLSLMPGVQERGGIRVAAVQTNVAQNVKGVWTPEQRMADLDDMLDMTVRACAAEPPPELVVWPETMFPGSALDADSLNEERAANLVWHTGDDVAWPVLRWTVWRGVDGIDEPVRVTGPFTRGTRLAMPTTVAADSVFVRQAMLGVPLLIGAEGIDGLRLTVTGPDGAIEEQHDAIYNSSYLIEGGRIQGERYDKIHLTPFGEVMPYVSNWPWLESLMLRIGVGASGMTFDLSPGDKLVAHVVPTSAGLVRIATPICFEGIMPDLCRKLTYAGHERRADLLVQLTNEGWFGRFDPGRLQHLQIVRWRAVELGTSVVRAANTGVSGVIGPDGRIIAAGCDAGRTNVAGIMSAVAPLTSGSTPYARIGDAVGWANLAATGIVLLIAVVRGRPRQSPRPPRTDEEGGNAPGQPARTPESTR